MGWEMMSDDDSVCLFFCLSVRRICGGGEEGLLGM